MGSIFSCQNHPLFLLDSWHILYRKNLIWGLYLAAKFILKVVWSVKGVILFFFFFWLLQCLLFEWSMMINPKACFSKNIRSGRLRAFASPGLRACAAPILPWMSETPRLDIILYSIFLYCSGTKRLPHWVVLNLVLLGWMSSLCFYSIIWDGI